MSPAGDELAAVLAEVRAAGAESRALAGEVRAERATVDAYRAEIAAWRAETAARFNSIDDALQNLYGLFTDHRHNGDEGS